MKKTPVTPLFPIYQVDSFADAPFKGNPAGVCFLMGHKSDEWMQEIAKEMNLSETAFFKQKNGHYSLRWFTPTVEVDLCGHATLATAHVIWETQMVGAHEELQFETRSGMLKARKKGDWIELDFPAQYAEPCEAPEDLETILGTAFEFIGFDGSDYLVELESADMVRAVQPDFAGLAKMGGRGFIVTARSDDERSDFISRFFCPAVGIPEDPVTGSAHCTLATFWAKKMDKEALTGYQASERGGIVQVELGENDRVFLRGKAVTVMQGVITEQGISEADS